MMSECQSEATCTREKKQRHTVEIAQELLEGKIEGLADAWCNSAKRTDGIGLRFEMDSCEIADEALSEGFSAMVSCRLKNPFQILNSSRDLKVRAGSVH